MNADLFFLLALQQARSEGLVDSHCPTAVQVWCLFTLVCPTQAGLAWPIGAQVRPVFRCEMRLVRHCCTILGSVWRACVDSGLPPSTLSYTGLPVSSTPAERELKSSLTDFHCRKMVYQNGEQPLLLSQSGEQPLLLSQSGEQLLLFSRT